MSAEDSVRLAWRLTLTKWMDDAPANRGAGASIGPAFVCFLQKIGDIVDEDGSSHPRFHLSKERLAKFCRTAPDSIDRFYRAAMAAGILAVEWTPKGARIRSCRLAFPLGGRPDWDAAIEVLRDSRQMRNKRKKKEDEVLAASAADAQTPSRDGGVVEVETPSRDGVLVDGPETQTPSRDASKPRHVTPETPSHDGPTRSTRHYTSMAGSVETVADTRARGEERQALSAAATARRTAPEIDEDGVIHFGFNPAPDIPAPRDRVEALRAAMREGRAS